MAQDSQANTFVLKSLLSCTPKDFKSPKVNGNTNQEGDDGQRLTTETQAQVPNGPSNTTTYLSIRTLSSQP